MLLCHQHLRDNFRKVSELKAVDLRPLGPSGRLVCSRLERSFFVHYHGKMIDQEEEEASSIREYPVDQFVLKVEEDRRGFVSLCLERGFFVVGLASYFLRKKKEKPILAYIRPADPLLPQERAGPPPRAPLRMPAAIRARRRRRRRRRRH